MYYDAEDTPVELAVGANLYGHFLHHLPGGGPGHRYVNHFGSGAPVSYFDPEHYSCRVKLRRRSR